MPYEKLNGDHAGGQRRPLLLPEKSSMLTRANSEYSENNARKMLKTRASVLVEGAESISAAKNLVEQAHINGIIFPWMPAYKVWWSITVVGAVVTAFFAPFQVAFESEIGTFQGPSALVEMTVSFLFAMDIGVNFNLAFYKDEVIVYERCEIFKEYFFGMFWIDFLGVFPFQHLALMYFGEIGTNSRKALLLSLLRLIRFVRLHRMKNLSQMLQYDARVSLMWFTLLRNLAAVLLATHSAACTMYFLARINGFSEDTWLGPQINSSDTIDRYITSLYWSVVTFCTVGYGDLAPVNTMEQTACVVFMLFYIVVAAWIIGSITLLVVKGDEKTGKYRDTLQTLHQYSQIHQFDESLENGLRAHLRLEFDNREIADEQVLKNFPNAIRRKILRKLYLKPLVNTQLMKNIRQRFVDAFLASCKVEIFSPGQVIVERGSIVADLFLLVGGVAEITTPNFAHASKECFKGSNFRSIKLEAGQFIGEIGFFTESPQVDTVTCVTVCKTLTMSQASYKMLAQDHPGSVGKILKNLLFKLEDLQLELPKDLDVLRAGSMFDMEGGYGTLALEDPDADMSAFITHRKEALTAVKDLVKMHMNKQLDDQTTRFCYAASRGDTSTIALMCDHGFDPDNSDYDSRTALMVAAMKGNTNVVRMLLEYKCDPNRTDMHGSSALLEAVKNGHRDTMAVLLGHGAQLCMSQSLAASVMCQAVFDGDIILLKRLLDAGIQVDASDYDKRTASHIAAAEGNVAAIRILAERGADLTLQDRWGNTVREEALRSNARVLLDFLEKRKQAYV